ncbi:hypothetical protein GCM10027578_08160 [Spirosoma luteolum]
MRTLPTLLMLLLMGQAVVGQPPIDTLHWSASRRLRLSDFHGPAQRGLGGSEFHYQLGYDMRPLLLGTQPAVEAYCLMFRNLSWVSETARNDRTLVYNQVLFDLVEIHARRMKAQLIGLRPDRRFKEQATRIEYLTNAELGREVSQFRAETGGGDEAGPLREWQLRIAQRLSQQPALKTVYRQSAVGYGLVAGGGVALPVGALAQTMRPAAGLSYGVDLAYRRTMLLASMGLYQASLQQSFTEQTHTWDTGMGVRSTLLEVALGRTLSHTARQRLVPYVGYRRFGMQARDRTDERYKGYTYTSHSPVVGVLLDLKLGDNSHRPDRIDDRFWFVRTKVSYSPLLTSEALSGGFLNLQVSLGGFGQLRRVCYEPR